jgi:hypothetical protein
LNSENQAKKQLNKKDFTPSESDGVKSICEENFAVKQQYKGWKKF